MDLLHRKTRWQRVADSLVELLERQARATDHPALAEGLAALPTPGKSKGLGKLPKPIKTGLVAAGGVAGVTAGSALVSSVRRRGEQSEDAS